MALHGLLQHKKIFTLSWQNIGLRPYPLVAAINIMKLSYMISEGVNTRIYECYFLQLYPPLLVTHKQGLPEEN